MKVSLDFEIGDKTCASCPGKFCQFVRVSRFGTRTCCSLFHDSYRENISLHDDNFGWLARCQACLEAFPPEAVEEKADKGGVDEDSTRDSRLDKCGKRS